MDPDALRWTPSNTLNTVLSEEEREAEMDVCSPGAKSFDDTHCTCNPERPQLSAAAINWNLNQFSAPIGSSNCSMKRGRSTVT